MAAKNQPKSGGRKAGTPNKRSQRLQDRADALGIDPFDILLFIAGNKWDKLGYDTPTTLRYNQQGDSYEIDRIEVSERNKAAKEAAQYIHPKLKSILHKGTAGGLINDLMALTPEERARRMAEYAKRKKMGKKKRKKKK